MKSSDITPDITSDVSNDITSDKDIRERVSDDTHIYLYTDLDKITYKDLLPKSVILYLKQGGTNTVGHWVGVTSGGGKDPWTEPWIEFFDPYGKMIDTYTYAFDNSFNLSKEQAQQLGEYYPHLLKLLLQFPGKLYYNHFQFQEASPDVATCGKHVTLRLNTQGDMYDYHRKMNKAMKMTGLNPDDIVRLLW